MKQPQSLKTKSFLLLFAALLIAVTLMVGLIAILQDLPSPKRITHSDNYAVSTQIFDRNGELLYEIYGNENRTPVAIEALPDHLLFATIAIEDKNFYRHHGFDLRGITRAALNNLRGERIEGGSTITQQLVKNALLSSERSYSRKAKEAVLAIFTEVIYDKDEILEMYLNHISYGGTSVGIEAAAQSYFDIPASELSLAQAALLAGLPQAPSRYSPFGSNPQAALNRQKEVLRRMHEDGHIDEETRDQAAAEVLTFALSRTDIRAPHFVFYVRDLLYEQYGTEVVERGGLRVTTTLDLELHTTAQASLSAQVDALAGARVSNGAALIIKPDTGEILSMIGSKDYFNATDEGQVNVTLAQRQPGSSIKPLMYAAAFDQKALNPGTILIDMPTCFTAPGQEPYCPRNYDGSFRGAVTVREALGNSLNIPAVKGLRILGVEQFMQSATAMGITSWTDPSRYGLSLTLGGGEVRMVDLAQAFATLANTGVKAPITPILAIDDFRGNSLYTLNIEKRQEDLAELNANPNKSKAGDLERALQPAAAYLVSHILQDNNARLAAFGARSALVIPDQIVSVKTGTTNDLKDNWTVGYTPEYLVATWVGNNDNTPMNRRVVSGVTGAAPIFNDIMRLLLANKESAWQEKPTDVTAAEVCASGMPPADGQPCRTMRTEYFWEKSNPSASQIITQDFWIDPTTGLPPAYGQEADGLVIENRTFYQDPITDLFCADCSRPTTEDGRVIWERAVIDHQKEVGTPRYDLTQTQVEN